MGKKRTTRKDVAELAGVSTATVSYVLNKTPSRISPETELKVELAAKELHYSPNLIARSLRNRKSQQLSILLEDISNPIYGDFVQSFEQLALEHGFFVNICTGSSRIDDYLDNFLARSIEGVVIESFPFRFHTGKIEQLIDAGIKIAIFGHGITGINNISHMETDYLKVMDLAVGYLHQLGHKKIVYLSGFLESDAFDLRLTGYRKAMDHFFQDQNPLFICGEHALTSIMAGHQLVEKLLYKTKNFTALICTNDLMAIGCIQKLKSLGIRVPEDISVVGIDDSSLATLILPALTTIRVNFTKMGQDIFKLLQQDILHSKTDTKYSEIDLIVRDSTTFMGG